MFGPKLDSRSYAILILAVIGLLVGSTLIAQTRSSAEGASEVASATREVAAATSRVADSNARIAVAIEGLASAVREASRANSSTSSSSAPSTGDSEHVAPDSTVPESGQEKQEKTENKGVFQLK